MSYHQAYEFLALDRPLRPAELAEVNKISSHATVSPNRFAVSYDYGDLRGDPDDILLRWFDVHYYSASECARFAVKLPAALLDASTMRTFEVSEIQEFTAHGPHLLVIWRCEYDDGGWIDDSEVAGTATDLAGVRSALLRGELWPLYLGWLSGQLYLADDETQEMPVPSGLSVNDPACRALANLLGITDQLLAAAAEASRASADDDPSREVLAWLTTQPASEKDAALTAVLLGESDEAVTTLRQRMALWRRSATKPEAPPSTVAHLKERAQLLHCEWRQADADSKARQRAAHLADVARRSEPLWAQAHLLRSSYTSSAPKQAVTILVDLADAADAHGTRTEFDAKLAAFIAPLNPIRALHKHLVAAGLARK